MKEKKSEDKATSYFMSENLFFEKNVLTVLSNDNCSMEKQKKPFRKLILNLCRVQTLQ